MVVLLVHREDVVKLLAVARRDAPGPLGAQVETAGECAPLGTMVRRASDVPGAGTRGVHEDLILQPLAPQHVLEDPLGQRRTADITQANEQYAYHLCVIYQLSWATCGRRTLYSSSLAASRLGRS